MTRNCSVSLCLFKTSDTQSSVKPVLSSHHDLISEAEPQAAARSNAALGKWSLLMAGAGRSFMIYDMFFNIENLGFSAIDP